MAKSNNNNKHWAKIVKKEKDGPTLRLKLGPTEFETCKITWEEFDKLYEIRDGEPFKAYNKKEYLEKVKKADDFYSQAITYFIRFSAIHNSTDPKLMDESLTLGCLIMDLVKKAGEIIGVDEPSSMDIFRRMLKDAMNALVGIGATITNTELDALLSDENLKAVRERREKLRKESESKPNDTSSN